MYAHRSDGVVLWVLADDGGRYRLTHDFPVTFCASGPFHRLRALWRYLRSQPVAVRLSRQTRNDLFQGLVEVLAVEVAQPYEQPRLFRRVRQRFPELTYYDAELELSLRYAATYQVFPLGRCKVITDAGGKVHNLEALDSRWDIDAPIPPLRVLTIEPDVNPAHAPPTTLTLQFGRTTHRFSLASQPRHSLIRLKTLIGHYDPDIILARWGDTWLFPHLFDLARRCGVSFNPNRDTSQRPRLIQERSYFIYGQVVFRGRQTHLYGRWHLDPQNALLYGEYGLRGVFENARVTAQPVQVAARKSPGAGITAMQAICALENDVLIPYAKQQTEFFKGADDLMRADQGGMVYQPRVGLHRDVAALDFFSMYPSLMVQFNISPETVGVHSDDVVLVPGLGMPIDQTRAGLVPETLRPLLQKRMTLKQRLATLNPRDCRYRPLKARVAALKWLLVVAFGYAGYKHATFGRIEAHQAITAFSREMLLRAKEVCEEQGFEVLHMYIDGLYIKKQGVAEVADFQPLLAAIAARTGLAIELDGIFRWLAFLPSRRDARVPVANRFFGAFQDGSLKIRGIEIRRGDTPQFIRNVQLELLEHLAQAPDDEDLAARLPMIVTFLRGQFADLRAGRVPLEDLVVAQRLSRELDEYKTPSPAARAAGQLGAVGKRVRPGQRVRFLFTCTTAGVLAWDLPQRPHAALVDRSRYAEMFIRAAHTVLQVLDVDEPTLRLWLYANAGYGGPPGEIAPSVKANRKGTMSLPVSF